MIYALCATAGFVVGAVVVFAWSAVKRARENSELRAKAESFQGRLEEVRRQLEEKESNITGLRKELDEERSLRTDSKARIDEERKSIEEQRKFLDEAKKKLSDTFDALAGKALKNSSEEFIKLAKETLGKILESTKGELGEKQNELKMLVKPLQTAVEQYEKHVKEMEKNLKGDYRSIDEQIKALEKTNRLVQQEAGNLASALRQPQVRGQWGELMLRNAVEIAGMSEHCDFEEQVTGESDDERRGRPDLMVNLPGNRVVLVDSKVPRDDYMNAFEARDEETKEASLKQHAKRVREHMKALARKEYWKQFENSTGYVVMFLPGESFFSAALMHDRTLIEDGAKQNVMLTSPTTLIALLRAAAMIWYQSEIAENAREIAEAGKELFERVRTFGSHFGNVGASLEKARDAFNKAVGSWESRVRPSGHRLMELGAVTESLEIKDVKKVEKPLRELPTELQESE